MSTTFMLMNNPMDLIMNLIVDTADNEINTSLDGAIENIKLTLMLNINKLFLRLRCMGMLSSISYI